MKNLTFMLAGFLVLGLNISAAKAYECDTAPDDYDSCVWAVNNCGDGPWTDISPCSSSSHPCFAYCFE